MALTCYLCSAPIRSRAVAITVDAVAYHGNYEFERVGRTPIRPAHQACARLLDDAEIDDWPDDEDDEDDVLELGDW